ncbi:Cytochrome P450 [Metarhizium rileyi]|uniref:Cytochrome P450 n=1 Tax=Metarhizium rileyi (strain RCEF 4871) TaxID=1649241 RepID=A0A162J2F6_METRR|nr:Cytochrome P450 [Metarhizium rileyi RCEF 4871]
MGMVSLPEINAKAFASADALAEGVIHCLKAAGACVIRQLYNEETVAKIDEEVEPYLTKENNLTYFQENVVTAAGLAGKSETFAVEVIGNPMWTAVGDHQGIQKTSVQLGSAAALELRPGALAQGLHRDDMVSHGYNTEAKEYSVGRDRSLTFFLASSKTHSANGATRVVPGSHLWDYSVPPPPADDASIVTAEMERGDSLIILGSVYHGGGANTTENDYRRLYTCGVLCSYLRQPENQYLANDVAKTVRLPIAIQKFLGYSPFPPGSKAFYLNTDNGPRLVLSNEYAREIHNSPHLSLPKAIEAELHAYIPGMEGYRHDYFPVNFGVGTMRLNVARALSLLSELDVSSVLDAYWTKNPAWHRFALSPMLLEMTAQLTAEVRSGRELSLNPQWRQLSVDFTVHTFMAASEVNNWPRFLRRVIHWFLPSSRLVRDDIREARALFAPVIDARMAKKQEAIANGREPPEHHDMMYWMDARSRGGPFDAVMAQLMIAQAMIHGIADLTTQTLFHICERPSLLKELREEMKSLVTKTGLNQDSLSHMHLLDSVVKESLRVKPLFLVNMKRYAEESITLSDGTVIPKGSLLVVAMQDMWDESKYPNARQFQSDRFLKRRQVPGQESSAELSSSTSDHMGFGFGRHACPGRFYASALIKLLLCHMLLKYDMRLVGESPPIEIHGVNTTANHRAEIEVRRRQEDIIV